MQSSYQFHFGGNSVFGGGSIWGDQGGAAGASQGGISGFASEVGCHEKNASSVKEYAYTEDKNFKFRPQMEDSKRIDL